MSSLAIIIFDESLLQKFKPLPKIMLLIIDKLEKNAYTGKKLKLN